MGANGRGEWRGTGWLRIGLFNLEAVYQIWPICSANSPVGLIRSFAQSRVDKLPRTSVDFVYLGVLYSKCPFYRYLS